MKLGTYRYSYAVRVYPVLQLSVFTLRVEVLAEEHRGTSRALWYKVRFMQQHADMRQPNTVTWVKAQSVQLDEKEPRPQREIRLPYKDNDNDD